VVFYAGLLGAATVFGGGRGGQVPFDVGSSGDKGDIIEVAYLSLRSAVAFLRRQNGDRL
jgi:hypothetical protein